MADLPELALSFLCMLLAFLAVLILTRSWYRTISTFSTVISWICYSLAFYIIGAACSHQSCDRRSASHASSALLFIGLANSIVCRSIPNAQLNLRASYQQLVLMVFVLVLLVPPWGIGPRAPFAFLLVALFLLWLAERRYLASTASERGRIKDDLLISKYMARKETDNHKDLSTGYLSGCNYIVGGEITSTTSWAFLTVFLKHLTNFTKGVRERGVQNIPNLLRGCLHDLQYASTPGTIMSAVIRYDKLVTVEDIWKHIPPLTTGNTLSYAVIQRLLRLMECLWAYYKQPPHSPHELPVPRTGQDGRDICLSFALFKLLRRRFRRCPLHESSLAKTWEFALHILFSDPPSFSRRAIPGSFPQRSSSIRAFHIIEEEIGFLFDFFYGNHLPDFAYLLSSLAFIVWTTALSILSHYKFWDEHNAQGIHAIASAEAIFFMFPLMWAWHIYIVARTTNLNIANLLVYTCQRRKRSSLNQGISSRGVPDWVLRLLLRNRSFKSRYRICWANRARQYCLLLQYGYFPRCTARNISDETKEALLNALRRSDRVLSDGRSALSRNGEEELSWACHQEFVAEKIIVWHIATTLCHAQPSTTSTQSNDKNHEEAATCLSGYCAYLVGFAPELIADDIYATRVIFDNARSAALERVQGEGSIARMSESAKQMHVELRTADFDAITQLDLIFQGKMLAAQLMKKQVDIQWKVLAEFWAELMLFISPADNAAAHLEKLKTGGELITHIWALLTHAGIVERPSGSQMSHLM